MFGKIWIYDLEHTVEDHRSGRKKKGTLSSADTAAELRGLKSDEWIFEQRGDGAVLVYYSTKGIVGKRPLAVKFTPKGSFKSLRTKIRIF